MSILIEGITNDKQLPACCSCTLKDSVGLALQRLPVYNRNKNQQLLQTEHLGCLLSPCILHHHHIILNSEHPRPRCPLQYLNVYVNLSRLLVFEVT